MSDQPGLFAKRLHVVNVGLDSFADVAATSQSADVSRIAWRPPLDSDPATAALVQQAYASRAIDEATQASAKRFIDSNPSIVDVGPARDHIGALATNRLLLHAGPPIDVEAMCGPMIGALIGACISEGWAPTPSQAEALLRSGSIEVAPCHDHGAVGPMAGVIAPSMPVWVLEDSNGRRTFSNVNEGLGKVLRFGAYEPEVIDRLRWMRTVLGPVLSDAIRRVGPIPVKPVMAQALHMGDEVHNRNAAATGQLLKRLAGAIAHAPTANGPIAASDAAAVLSFIGANDHFFLNVSMAACKAMLDAASGIEHSAMVTAMARNGVEFGIRLSGTGNQWFCAPAQAVHGLYFPGYGPPDANPDLGDSAITETAGVGAFAMAAAPAIVGFVGGTADDAINYTQTMRELAIATNPAFTIPALGFAPTVAGIDARHVVDTGIVPVINTGIAHRNAGVGQIGAGVTSAPWTCFTDGIIALLSKRTTQHADAHGQ